MDPGIIAVFIPIAGIGAGVIGMLINHQQKMTQIIHQQRSSGVEVERIEILTQEVRDLKALLTQQMIAMDDLRGLNRHAPPPTASVSDPARLHS